MARKRLKLGEILVQHGALTPAALEEGLKSAAAARKRLGDALIEAGAAMTLRLPRPWPSKLACRLST